MISVPLESEFTHNKQKLIADTHFINAKIFITFCNVDKSNKIQIFVFKLKHPNFTRIKNYYKPNLECYR